MKQRKKDTKDIVASIRFTERLLSLIDQEAYDRGITRGSVIRETMGYRYRPRQKAHAQAGA